MKHIRAYNENKKISRSEIEEFHYYVKTVYADFFDEIEKYGIVYNYSEDGLILGDVKSNYAIGFTFEEREIGSIQDFIKLNSDQNELLLDLEVGIKRIKDQYPNIQHWVEHWSELKYGEQQPELDMIWIHFLLETN